MTDFTINEMRSMQEALQKRYKDKWEPITPGIGKNKLLWMIGEIGEVIDIIKKNGDQKVTADELKEAYIRKFERNMKRW